MRIRAAEVSDAPAMGRVMVDTFMTAHKGQIPEDAWKKRQEEWSYEVSERAWARDLAALAASPDTRECFFVAENETGEVVGLILGQPDWEDNPETTGDVGALYVLPEYHGQGIGRRLVQAAARMMAGWGMTTLHIRVLKTNLPARGFYEAIGGLPVGERMDDSDGVQVIYAWKDLSVL